MGTQTATEAAMADRSRNRRQSARLKGFDYGQPGAYFVTIVTQDRFCMFGNIVEEKMLPNAAGVMIQMVWESLSQRYVHIALDAFVLMPNHVHGIIVIDRPVGVPLVGTQNGTGSSTPDAGLRATTRVAPTIGDIVGAYKSITTVEYTRGVRSREWRPFRRRLWQRNYYEHVIRDDDELNRAREYITNNPLKWELDSENPDTARATR